MNYLIDTHTLIWSIDSKEKLSERATHILEDTTNSIQVSAISFWEISLKYSIGKLKLQDITPQEFPAIALKIGFDLLPLLPEETAQYHLIKGEWHRDPFDRMLIRQAIQHDMTLISKDEDIHKYSREGLKVLW